MRTKTRTIQQVGAQLRTALECVFANQVNASVIKGSRAGVLLANYEQYHRSRMLAYSARVPHYLGWLPAELGAEVEKVTGTCIVKTMVQFDSTTIRFYTKQLGGTTSYDVSITLVS